jgi:hypothetical protein
MPRFFFDIFDGEKLWVDDEGSAHNDLAAARHEAVDTLTSIGREVFPHGRANSLSIDIRTEDREAVERVVVTLSFQPL